MVEFKIQSNERTAFIPITRDVQGVVSDQDWKRGVLTVYVPHTTAAVTIQENADPDVARDLIFALEKAVPWNDPEYRHAEGNAAAHVKAAMLGASAQCLVEEGKLLLGTWQGIFFCEFDGPRSRRVWLAFSAAPAE
ncbi:MAG: YjbQ family protein [Verrucomicrobia bacterium]|nr:YjbQ family protein [Verrucomicrobiota bacterium]